MANEPVSLILITWNRRVYVEKTLAKLLADPADFRLYCWDNASTDGTADIIASLDDPRVVHRTFSKENLNQREPFLWFLDRATSDVVGKVDDDILLPTGWTDRISPIVQRDTRFGMLGCWVFMPEDWNERLASMNIITIGDLRIFRTVATAGCGFLARRDCLRRYVASPGGYGLPIDRLRMSKEGLMSGYLLPLLLAHHMDDPRSPHNCFTRLGANFQQTSALTARSVGVSSPEEYARWIAQDARIQQKVPFERQLRRRWREHCLSSDTSLLGRVQRRFWRSFYHLSPWA